MTQLKVFSKKKVKYIPFNPSPEKRINFRNLLQPHFTKVLFVYEGIPFLVEFTGRRVFFLKKGGLLAQRHCASFAGVEWCYQNKKIKKMESIKYFIIAIDPKIIPSKLLDVLFFHELREMYYVVVCKNLQKTAHRKARKDEQEYMNKFLSPREKKIWQDFKKSYQPSIEEW